MPERADFVGDTVACFLAKAHMLLMQQACCVLMLLPRLGSHEAGRFPAPQGVAMD